MDTSDTNPIHGPARKHAYEQGEKVGASCGAFCAVVFLGSIFFILRSPRPGEDAALEDFLQPGTQQVCAGFALYGPSTLLIITFAIWRATGHPFSISKITSFKAEALFWTAILISNTLGTINPAAELCRRARAVGAVTVIDAAQSIGHAPLNVQALGCDFLVFSGHKMLGPTASGGLYAKREILEEMDGLPVTVRLLDPPLHEFLPRVDELEIKNATTGLTAEEQKLLKAAESWAVQSVSWRRA